MVSRVFPAQTIRSRKFAGKHRGCHQPLYGITRKRVIYDCGRINAHHPDRVLLSPQRLNMSVEKCSELCLGATVLCDDELGTTEDHVFREAQHGGRGHEAAPDMELGVFATAAHSLRRNEQVNGSARYTQSNKIRFFGQLFEGSLVGYAGTRKRESTRLGGPCLPRSVE